MYLPLSSVYLIYNTTIVHKCEIKIQKDIDVHKRELYNKYERFTKENPKGLNWSFKVQYNLLQRVYSMATG